MTSSTERSDYLELVSISSPKNTSRVMATNLDRTSHESLAKPATTEEETHEISVEEEKLPLGQAIKRYPKVVAYCLALTVTIIGWGYDLVIVGSITGVDAFQIDYGELYKGELIIPSIWLSMWMSMGRVGAVAGALAGGWIQDRTGRRLSLMIGSIISGIAVTILFFSYLPVDINGRRGMFLAGKIIQGVSVGIIKVTAVTYVSENTPSCLSGSAMALFPTFTLVGQLLGSVVVFVVNDVKGNAGYLGAFGSQWILALLPFILSIIMPESPAFLIRKGQDEKALRSAVRLFEPRVNARNIVARAKISLDEEATKVSDATYMDCFNSAHRRRTGIVMIANLFPAAFGLDLLSSSSYFVQQLGIASSTSLIFLIAGVVVGMLANGLGIWLLSFIGRRMSTLVSIVIAGLLWTGMGIAGFFKGQGVGYAAAASMILIIAVCGMGCWPAGYAIMGETSALRLRSKTQAIGNMTQQVSSVVMAVILPYIFNPDAGDAGAKTGFVFTGLCAMAVAATWFYIPETKGRSVMELDHMFDIELPTRQFKDWTKQE